MPSYKMVTQNKLYILNFCERNRIGRRQHDALLSKKPYFSKAQQSRNSIYSDAGLPNVQLDLKVPKISCVGTHNMIDFLEKCNLVGTLVCSSTVIFECFKNHKSVCVYTRRHIT